VKQRAACRQTILFPGASLKGVPPLKKGAHPLPGNLPQGFLRAPGYWGNPKGAKKPPKRLG